MPEQATSKLTSVGPGEGWPCFDLCLSECERAGVQRLNVTSADNLLVVQSSAWRELTAHILYVLPGLIRKNTNQEGSLGTSPHSENRDRLCHCGFQCVCKSVRVCTGALLQYSQYSCVFSQCRMSC